MKNARPVGVSFSDAKARRGVFISQISRPVGVFCLLRCQGVSDVLLRCQDVSGCPTQISRPFGVSYSNISSQLYGR